MLKEKYTTKGTIKLLENQGACIFKSWKVIEHVNSGNLDEAYKLMLQIKPHIELVSLPWWVETDLDRFNNIMVDLETHIYAMGKIGEFRSQFITQKETEFKNAMAK